MSSLVHIIPRTERPDWAGPAWPDFSDADKTLLNVIFDLRLKRLDHAVFGRLLEAYGFGQFVLDRKEAERVAAMLADWGRNATLNKVALSIKRLARFGHISSVTEEVFRLGIERKAIARKLRQEVMERDQSTCRLCGATSNLQIDHILARTKGGENTADNLQVLCVTCNVRKGNA